MIWLGNVFSRNPAQELRQELALIDSIRRRLLCVNLKGMDRQNVALSLGGLATFQTLRAGCRISSGDWTMPIFLFNDGSVEIACPRCGSTSPRTAAWVHANDRYNCPACNTEITLNQDRQLAELASRTLFD